MLCFPYGAGSNGIQYNIVPASPGQQLNYKSLSDRYVILNKNRFHSRGSNPRPPSPQLDALPYELLGLSCEPMKILEFIYYIPSNYALCVQSRKSSSAGMVYIRTVCFQCLWSILLNQLKLVYGPFGQSNMHSTLDFCSRSARKESNVPLR